MDNVLQFRPLAETLQEPFRAQSLKQIALTMGLIVAVTLMWIQVLHPVGERLGAMVKETIE